MSIGSWSSTSRHPSRAVHGTSATTTHESTGAGSGDLSPVVGPRRPERFRLTFVTISFEDSLSLPSTKSPFIDGYSEDSADVKDFGIGTIVFTTKFLGSNVLRG